MLHSNRNYDDVYVVRMLPSLLLYQHNKSSFNMLTGCYFQALMMSGWIPHGAVSHAIM